MHDAALMVIVGTLIRKYSKYQHSNSTMLQELLQTYYPYPKKKQGEKRKLLLVIIHFASFLDSLIFLCRNNNYQQI